MDEKKKDALQKTQVKIEIDEKTADGIYINSALISHTQTEFVLDFLFLQPQTPKAKVRSRIITSPGHAKRLLLALHGNINKYEQKFGQIKIAGGPEEDKKTGFIM